MTPEFLERVKRDYDAEADNIIYDAEQSMLDWTAYLAGYVAAIKRVETLEAALREIDLTGIQYQEKPVDAVGRMRGIAMAALRD